MWKLRHVFKSRSAKGSPSTRSQSGTRNASPSLTIEDRYYFHATTVFGLRIETGSERPVIVGYSIQCKNGHILDVPAHQLNASGLVLWHIEAPQACQNGEGTPYDGWSGRIVFALWEDETFQNCLARTGWVPWEAGWLLGSSSRAISLKEDAMREKYGNRVASWSFSESS